jgi:hypothetical protein
VKIGEKYGRKKAYWRENMVAVGQIEQTDRDEMGRFREGNLAKFKHGMRARKFKKIWCNNCYIGQRCKFFEERAVCIKERKLIKKYETRDLRTIVNMLWDELDDIGTMLEIAEWYEVKEGGKIKEYVNRLVDIEMRIFRALAKIYIRGYE